MPEIVWVVVQDTSGAHEPEASYSIWTTELAALNEAQRLNTVRQGDVYPYDHETDYEVPSEQWPIAPALMGRPSGSGAFYVVTVTLDTARDEHIG